MSLTVKRPRYYRTKVSSKDPKDFRIAGDIYEDKAKQFAKTEDYKSAWLDHKRAIKCYEKALKSQKDNVELRELIDKTRDESEKSRRMAALYRATENMPLKGLIRKVKGWHILGALTLALFFSAPNLTGSVIGNSGFSSFLGLFLFSKFLFLLYFLIKRKLISK